MTDTVYHAPFAGNNEYGAPVFGSAVAYFARVVYKDHNVRDNRGEERLARGYVWLAAAVEVTYEDQITLPDGTTPPIWRAMKFHDELGHHHTEISFGYGGNN